MAEEIVDLEDALARDEEAMLTFSWLAPTHRREFLNWIDAPQLFADRHKRIGEVMDILAGRDVVRKN